MGMSGSPLFRALAETWPQNIATNNINPNICLASFKSIIILIAEEQKY
jgi:hypothetical protein